MKNYKYKAYIAANEHTQAFDFAYGETAKSASSAVKRKNSPDWKDCIVWVVFIHNDPYGEEILDFIFS